MPKITLRRMNDAPSHHVADASMYEATLRKLTRAKLQMLAKKNKIKANMKSKTIIQELLKLHKAVPPSEPTRTARGETPVAGPSTQIIDTVADTNLDHQPVTQEGSQKSVLSAENSAPKDAADIAAVSSDTGRPAPLDDDSSFSDDDAFIRAVDILLQNNPEMRLSIGDWPYTRGIRDHQEYPPL
ncbi:hypothetical protein EDD22DRAFT_1014185 [Suillus occidentalis]|nr:hypothetical protein EDD22DRAFT_1014185 [Suillus occidentalis]